MAKTPKDKTDTAFADTSAFSDEELKALELEAVEEAKQEDKENAAIVLKEQIKREHRKKQLFAAGKDAKGQDLEAITIDLAPNSADITLDGVKYFHGGTYRFTKAQAQTIKEAMFRTWEHEREIGGANINAERGYRSLNRHI